MAALRGLCNVSVYQVTEFQSRLLVAAAVQASGGNHTHPSALPTNTLGEVFHACILTQRVQWDF